MKRIAPRLSFAVLALALALTGCSAKDDVKSDARTEVTPGFLSRADSDLPQGGTLTIALDYDVVESNGLDPQTAENARSWMITGLSYQTLVTVDENFAIKPELATSWDLVSPTEYVFHLRRDAKFSNGRTMTSDDVKGSLERLLDSTGSWAAQLGAISSIETNGDYEVTLRLSEPSSALLGALASTPAAIIPVEEVSDGSLDLAKEMVGTGPYVAVAHKQDQSWVFEKNEYYYDADKVGIDKLELNIVPDEASRQAAIRDGSAQYAFFNNTGSLDQLTGASNVKVVDQQNTDFYYLVINSTTPGSPLADPEVRLAINAAIDRAQLSDLVLDGKGVATGVAPAPLPGGCDASQLPSATMSTDEIKQVLASAGAEGMKLTLETYNSETAPGNLAQVIQQSLESYGITLEVKLVDGPTFGADFYGDDKPAAADMTVNWYLGYGDAAMVSRWWNTEQSTFTSRFYQGSPEINELVDEAASQEAGAERDATLTELCSAVDEGSEMVPLVTRPGVIAYRSDMLSPTINSTEGYGDILRFVTDFRTVGER